ncbi:uncharacterized protein UDID_18496 [Ustilago sp. UG-2017a]|nr:uncharacterized protein UDID_18496 [Ustilago sp. UG-2017a]
MGTCMRPNTFDTLTAALEEEIQVMIGSRYEKLFRFISLSLWDLDMCLAATRRRDCLQGKRWAAELALANATREVRQNEINRELKDGIRGKAKRCFFRNNGGPYNWFSA